LKNGEWEIKGYGSVMEGIEWTKEKYTYSGDELRNQFEHLLRY
jgi:hypothetical protein